MCVLVGLPCAHIYLRPFLVCEIPQQEDCADIAITCRVPFLSDCDTIYIGVYRVALDFDVVKLDIDIRVGCIEFLEKSIEIFLLCLFGIFHHSGYAFLKGGALANTTGDNQSVITEDVAHERLVFLAVGCAELLDEMEYLLALVYIFECLGTLHH